ncbi:MAG: 50S ribosomal protein L5 [Candidatus Micrarchaeota archaeon]|nr:50S ribosomal protein L5 [Candidatus Micrarchaeota archaeon]
MVNPMQNIRLDKLVVNVGIGSTEDKIDNARALLKKLTGREAAHTKAKKRFPEFGIRKGQIIGAVVTLRNKQAEDFLRSALDASNNALGRNAIANNSVNFGIKEYIEFSGVKYDPKIGMLGLNVNASFSRPGVRVELRKRKSSSVGIKHRRITREELQAYLEKNFGAKITEE